MMHVNSRHMMAGYLVLLFGGGGLQTHAQPNVVGLVRDAETGIPLASAHVSASTGAGTTTNALGQFVLRLDAFPATIHVSHLGYGSHALAAEALPTETLRVALQPSVYMLPEMEVVSEAYVHEIIRRAYEKARAYDRTDHVAKAFQRMLWWRDDDVVSMSEAFSDIRISYVGLIAEALTQGRYAFAAEATTDDLSVNWSRGFSYIHFFESAKDDVGFYTSLRPYPLSKKAPKDFRFTYEGRVREGEADYHIIAFELLEHAKQRQASYTGRLFIDAWTHHVLRFEGETLTEASYRGQAIRSQFTMEYGLDVDEIRLRNVTIKTIFFHEDGLEERYEGHLWVYDYDTDVEDRRNVLLNALTWRSADKAAIDARPYDASFWRDNPVVARTPVEEAVIEQFERAGAFGNLVPEAAPGGEENSSSSQAEDDP